MRRHPLRYLLVIAILVAALTGGSGVYAQQLGVRDYGSYEAALTALRADRAEAAQQGFSEKDLAAIDQRLAAVTARPAPIDPWEQPGFYTAAGAELAGIRQELTSRETGLKDEASRLVAQRVAEAEAALQQDETLGVPSDRLDAFRSTLDQLASTSDPTIADLRQRGDDLEAFAAQVAAAGVDQQQENQLIQQAAQPLQAQAASNPTAVRALGTAALTAGRNEASVAAYEDRAGRFAAMPQMNDAYDRLEHFGAELAGSDPAQLALAVAGEQHYAAKIQALFLDNLGPQHIIVSFAGQHVWVYEGSKVVMDSPVTTGIRGVTDYGTDFGPMKVLTKLHPFKFHSPYPRGSMYWYPDTWVQWTVFFTNSGESFHDAYWEPDYLLGPGSQYNPSTRSHGCIHIPYAKAEWLFGWADVGTPVDVVPYDGQTVANQLAEITTDNQGNPLNPA